jgi:hypothetical protein
MNLIKYFLSNLDALPTRMPFTGIPQLDKMSERFFDIEQVYGDIVGMNVDSIEFCPNNSPPDKDDEVLPWLWLIYPHLKEEILELADDKLKDLISK